MSWPENLGQSAQIRKAFSLLNALFITRPSAREKCLSLTVTSRSLMRSFRDRLITLIFRLEIVIAAMINHRTTPAGYTQSRGGLQGKSARAR